MALQSVPDRPVGRRDCIKLQQKLDWLGSRPLQAASASTVLVAARNILPRLNGRRCIRRIGFHEETIEPFSFAKVFPLLGSNGPIK
jgi:hypothetical protein